jgi:hypothetical protein
MSADAKYSVIAAQKLLRLVAVRQDGLRGGHEGRNFHLPIRPPKLRTFARQRRWCPSGELAGKRRPRLGAAAALCRSAPGYVFLAGSVAGVSVGGGGATPKKALARCAGEAAEVRAQLQLPGAPRTCLQTHGSTLFGAGTDTGPRIAARNLSIGQSRWRAGSRRSIWALTGPPSSGRGRLRAVWALPPGQDAKQRLRRDFWNSWSATPPRAGGSTVRPHGCPTLATPAVRVNCSADCGTGRRSRGARASFSCCRPFFPSPVRCRSMPTGPGWQLGSRRRRMSGPHFEGRWSSFCRWRSRSTWPATGLLREAPRRVTGGILPGR